MKQFELPFFGPINVESIKEEQEYMKVDFQDRSITLMWFTENAINDNYFQNANTILNNLDKFDDTNRLFLQNELTNTDDSTVVEFLEYHIEELSDELVEIIGESTNQTEKLETLSKVLKLNNISFHDDNIVADYVLNEEISDQILAISINSNGEKNVAWES